MPGLVAFELSPGVAVCGSSIPDRHTLAELAPEEVLFNELDIHNGRIRPNVSLDGLAQVDPGETLRFGEVERELVGRDNTSGGQCLHVEWTRLIALLRRQIEWLVA